MQLQALEPLFKILYTFVCKKLSSCRLKFPGKNCRQIYGKSKASIWRSLGTVTDPKFVSKILCCVALAYKSYFQFRTAILRKLFDIRFSYKHCNFHAFAYSSRWRRKPWQGLSVKETFLVLFRNSLSRQTLKIIQQTYKCWDMTRIYIPPEYSLTWKMFLNTSVSYTAWPYSYRLNTSHSQPHQR